jgi:hypothetical protein
MIHHLPGGTIDSLLASLLQHRASDLHIPYYSEPPASGDLRLIPLHGGDEVYFALYEGSVFRQPLRVLNAVQVETLIQSYKPDEYSRQRPDAKRALASLIGVDAIDDERFDTITTIAKALFWSEESARLAVEAAEKVKDGLP